jgi:hypothetical protein
MIKKYLVLIGVSVSLILMLIAISVYPGGSIYDSSTVGYNWTENFLSNLFAATALNGAENPSRIYACLAMITFPVSYAIFFAHMAKKIPQKSIAGIIKHGGMANIPFTFLTVIPPLHDLMLIISTTVFWSCLVCISALVLKTKLHVLKFFCVICILFFYYSVYVWGISDWRLLPITQKVDLINSTLLILGLEYFTKQEDFAHIKPKEYKELTTSH